MESVRQSTELKTIYLNLERAQRFRDWKAVDRATQRLAELLMELAQQQIM